MGDFITWQLLWNMRPGAHAVHVRVYAMQLCWSTVFARDIRMYTFLYALYEATPMETLEGNGSSVLPVLGREAEIVSAHRASRVLLLYATTGGGQKNGGAEDPFL